MNRECPSCHATVTPEERFCSGCYIWVAPVEREPELRTLPYGTRVRIIGGSYKGQLGNVNAIWRDGTYQISIPGVELVTLDRFDITQACDYDQYGFPMVSIEQQRRWASQWEAAE